MPGITIGRETERYIDKNGAFRPAIDMSRTIQMKTNVGNITNTTGIAMLSGTTPNDGKHFVFQQADIYQDEGSAVKFLFYDGTPSGTLRWASTVADSTATEIDLSYAGLCTGDDIYIDNKPTTSSDPVVNVTGRQWTQVKSSINDEVVPLRWDESGRYRIEPHPQECRESGVQSEVVITSGTGKKLITIGTGQQFQPCLMEVYHGEGSDDVFRVYDGDPASGGTLIFQYSVPTATRTVIDLTSVETCTSTDGVFVDVVDNITSASDLTVSLGGLLYTEQEV